MIIDLFLILFLIYFIFGIIRTLVTILTGEVKELGRK